MVERVYAVGEPVIVGDLIARSGRLRDFPVGPGGVARSRTSRRRPRQERICSGVVCTRFWTSEARFDASGRSLLALCKGSGKRIANGRTLGDKRAS